MRWEYLSHRGASYVGAIHRVSFSPSLRSEIGPVLDSLGLDYDESWLVFDIQEGTAGWPEVSQLMKRYLGQTGCSSTFDDETLREASWLAILAGKPLGYPLPTEDFAYLELSYDLSDYCRNCGIGWMQVAPLRISQDSVPDDADIFGLFWEVSEVFVKKAIWFSVFAPLGVRCWEVVCDETGEPFDSVVQLRVGSESQVDLEIEEDWPREECPDCRRVKLHPGELWRYHDIRRERTAGPVARTTEWFGSGGSGWQRILIKQDLCHRLLDARVQEVFLRPTYG